jgi:hypothetical protein
MAKDDRFSIVQVTTIRGETDPRWKFRNTAEWEDVTYEDVHRFEKVMAHGLLSLGETPPHD